jgi:replicative DNA helicase
VAAPHRGRFRLIIEKIVAKSRLAVRRHGVRLVSVDYIQIVGAAGRDERLRVAAISRGLTRLAKDEQVPVLALSQLSRPDRSAAKRRPSMSDLRESSQIENDSHVVLLIHRERDEDEKLLPEGQLIIAKQRSGSTGSIPVRYSGQTLTFEASESTREPIQLATRPQAKRGA